MPGLTGQKGEKGSHGVFGAQGMEGEKVGGAPQDEADGCSANVPNHFCFSDTFLQDARVTPGSV